MTRDIDTIEENKKKLKLFEGDKLPCNSYQETIVMKVKLLLSKETTKTKRNEIVKLETI